MDIKAHIRNKGMTLEEVGARMSKPMSQQSMSALLKADANPSINKLKEIAEIIGVSLSELLSDSSEIFVAMISDNGNLMQFNSKSELIAWAKNQG